MNLMSGSLWGVGFVIVDMRVKKLLKRLAATPDDPLGFSLVHRRQPAAVHAAGTAW